jgi:anti-sigma factor RsiW
MRWVHLNPEQLVDYFSSHWLPEQQAAIEVHLATCDICAQTAYKVFNTLSLADGWTAREQSKAQAEEVSTAYATRGFATARTA